MRVVSGGTPTGETIVKDGRTFSIVNGGTNQLIETLLAGVGSFARDILADSRALASVEMAIISFGDSVRIERDFMAVDSSLSSFSIEAIDDGTRLGQAVRTALELLDRRKGEYKEFGIKPFQPQIVILTDGCATDPDVCKRAGIEVQQRMKDQKLRRMPRGRGNGRSAAF